MEISAEDDNGFYLRKPIKSKIVIVSRKIQINTWKYDGQKYEI
jgi:hypothetical protein